MPSHDNNNNDSSNNNIEPGSAFRQRFQTQDLRSRHSDNSLLLSGARTVLRNVPVNQRERVTYRQEPSSSHTPTVYNSNHPFFAPTSPLPRPRAERRAPRLERSELFFRPERILPSPPRSRLPTYRALLDTLGLSRATSPEIPQDCPVCLQEIRSPTETACGHVFCSTCLHTWMARANTCPMCRTELSGTATMMTPTTRYSRIRNLQRVGDDWPSGDFQLGGVDNWRVEMDAELDRIWGDHFERRDGEGVLAGGSRILERGNWSADRELDVESTTSSVSEAESDGPNERTESNLSQILDEQIMRLQGLQQRYRVLIADVRRINSGADLDF